MSFEGSKLIGACSDLHEGCLNLHHHPEVLTSMTSHISADLAY